MKNSEIRKTNIAFFGTPKFSVQVLDELQKSGIIPKVIITAPDKPKGRKLIVTPPPTKVWAEKNNIEIIQPQKLDSDFYQKLKDTDCDLFIIAAYGKIIPNNILDIPKYKTLNIHPSLLPKYRGATPIQSAILSGDNETGMTIIQLDEEMDHGPILAQEIIDISDIPHISELSEKLARLGANILAEIIPSWIAGELKPKGQEHDLATFTKKIKTTDAEINLNKNPLENFRKIQSYGDNPKPYFFIKNKNNPDKKIRVIIKEADYKDGELILKKLIPEGKKEMDYKTLTNNFLK
ncbi:methionyl-tRNA formyltransferase [Patescibacteria group bacterium]